MWLRLGVHHLFAEKIETLQCPHSLRACLDISKNYVRLTSHAFRFESHHIEDGTIGRKQSIE